MKFFLDSHSYIYLLTFFYFNFSIYFCKMSTEEKSSFFNILSKTQLISIFFILIISSINLSNKLNFIRIYYIYLIIIINTIISIAIFYFKLDKVISNVLKNIIGRKLIHNLVVGFIITMLFIYLFFPEFNSKIKYTPVIITILFSLNFLTAKYMNKK